ncbi:MAG: four helix bundle protein [Myxococcales bacterium]
MTDSFVPPHGGYQKLLSYQKALIVHQGTVRFCQRFLDQRSRTVDQMVRASRSGKQNILEGSKASAASKESEFRLTNVARASLEELLEDYLDYLRERRLELWAKDCREALWVRRAGAARGVTFDAFRPIVENRPAGVVANAWSTRPTTCWTDSFVAWSGTSSSRVACGSV